MEQGLFGRETELARVSKLLDGIPSGPVALILGGEPGIGKSTLWLHSLSQAKARSYRALSCRPNESEAKLSYAALADLLEGVLDESLEGPSLTPAIGPRGRSPSCGRDRHPTRPAGDLDRLSRRSARPRLREPVGGGDR
jgi:Cdc6-like AAA superfamily ATPase